MKYGVVCCNAYGEVLQIKETDDPGYAIKTWFRLEKRSPLWVGISIENKKAAMELVEAADEVLVRSLHEKYGSPYKLSFLLDEVQRQRETGCRGYLGPGDSICPFDVG